MRRQAKGLVLLASTNGQQAASLTDVELCGYVTSRCGPTGLSH